MDLPGMDVSFAVVAAVGALALVLAAAVPTGTGLSRGQQLGIGLTTVAAVGQIGLAAAQGRTSHALALVPLSLACLVLLVRGRRAWSADHRRGE